MSFMRRVLLPKSLDEKLAQLAREPVEVCGTLLFRQKISTATNSSGTTVDCYVDALYLLGRGTPEEVRSDKKRVTIVNEFLSLNRGYNPLTFHTHDLLEDPHPEDKSFWSSLDEDASWFSEEDIEEFLKRREVDPSYMSLLATPNERKLWGKDHPQLLVVDDSYSTKFKEALVNLRLYVITKWFGEKWKLLEETAT